MATKDLELIDSHQDLRKSSSIVSRVYVEGYDTSLSGFELAISMKKHFASCGAVLHVHIPGFFEGFVLNRFALIYLRGEGAEDKALELSGRRLELIGGSYSRGGNNKLVVKPYPFRAKNPDRALARTRKEDKRDSRTMYVDGYDTSRPVDYLESMLFKHFSRCGQVLFVLVPKKDRVASLRLKGIHAIEKALQLCTCDVEGLENVKVCGVENPPRDGSLGCGMKVRSWPPEFDLSVMDDATAPEDPSLPKPPPWLPLVYSKGQPSSVIIRYAREDPSLPKPWKALVDCSTGFKYFWNTETNVTQYERPPSQLSSSSNYNLRKRVRR